MGIPAILNDASYKSVLMELKNLGFLTFEEGFFNLTSAGYNAVYILENVALRPAVYGTAPPATSLGQLLREKLDEGNRPAPAKTTIACEMAKDGNVLINESRMDRIFVQVTERLLRDTERQGNKVAAIKMVRSAAVPKLGLKQGKDFVDAVQSAIALADTPVAYKVVNCDLLA
jgi:hypothetical protein